jgi:hypothetical protein
MNRMMFCSFENDCFFPCLHVHTHKAETHTHINTHIYIHVQTKIHLGQQPSQQKWRKGFLSSRSAKISGNVLPTRQLNMMV